MVLIENYFNLYIVEMIKVLNLAHEYKPNELGQTSICGMFTRNTDTKALLTFTYPTSPYGDKIAKLYEAVFSEIVPMNENFKHRNKKRFKYNDSLKLNQHLLLENDGSFD